MKDDGVDTTQLSISDDGTTVAFTRGHDTEPQRLGRQSRGGPQRRRARDLGGEDRGARRAWRLAKGQNGVLSPDGRFVAYAKDDQIFRVPTAQGPRLNDIDKGLKPYIRIWGVNSNPVWSPNGKKLAFVSRRTDHSFIAVFDVATRKVTYMSPERGLRHQPDVVRRQHADRVHPAARHAVRAAVAERGRRPRQSAGAGVQCRGPGTRRRRGGGGGGQGRGGAPLRRGRAGHTRGAAPGTDELPLHRRLQHVVLGRRREDRRRAGVLAQREGRARLQRDQHDHLARRPRDLPARTGGVDALLCRAGRRSDGTAAQHGAGRADGRVRRR